MKIVSVTGTNGKTTVTTMISCMVAAAGQVPARVTTVGAWVGEERIEAPTLPEQFFATVARARERGVRILAVETTSKALRDGFASRCPPDVAVFTNLTRDHLDLHGTPEAYLAAKAQLFLALRPPGHAVLCADDPASALLREIVPPGVRVSDWSLRGPADLRADEILLEIGRSRARLVGALEGALELPVTGELHLHNALGAALAAKSLSLPTEAICQGLASFRGVPGRFELVSREPLVVLDYAHTPDALQRTLASARGLVPGRLVLVFGCGGERDAGKRPEMGRRADELADVVILTTDNPRGEDPAQIARQVRQEVSRPRASWTEVPDRRQAIALAVSEAGPTDLVLVAGKGHETAQEVAGQRVPFSDREEILRVTTGEDRESAWTSS